MKIKDTVILLAPLVLFLTVGTTALLIGDKLHQEITQDDSHQKFEAFAQNVESGKWQLTTDKWLEGMRRQQASTEAHLKTDASLGDLMFWIGWASFAGILLQAGAVLHVRRRLKSNQDASLVKPVASYQLDPSLQS